MSTKELLANAYAYTHMAADLAAVMDATPDKFTAANAVELKRLCQLAACAALALENKILGHSEPKRGD